MRFVGGQCRGGVVAHTDGPVSPTRSWVLSGEPNGLWSGLDEVVFLLEDAPE